MNDSNTPHLIRPVPLPRQFAVVGTIHSVVIGVFAGFIALATSKLAADALRPDADHLWFALACSAAAFFTAFLVSWTYHYWKLVVQRGRTTYAVFTDRVEVRREGSSTPADVAPFDRTLAVQSWTGPYQRPLGLATLTLVVEEPRASGGPARHVFHPLPNVPDAEAVAVLLQSQIDARRGRGSSSCPSPSTHS